MPAKHKKATKIEESIAVYSDPHVYEVGARIIAKAFKVRPTSPLYPGYLACYLLDLEARIHGNRQKAAEANRDIKLWALKGRLAEQVAGVRLPAVPPAPDTVRNWRNRWLPPGTREERLARDYTVLRPRLRDFTDAVCDVGVRRAIELGQFPPDAPKDFAKPHQATSMCMDGTYVDPYSQAELWTDGDVKLRLRSRAASDASVKQQAVVHRPKKDGRQFMGVNHVVAVTRSKFGRVFLGVTRSLGGENVAALALTEEIVRRAGDGVHTLVYDKAMTGWTRECLMANWAVDVVLPATSRRKDAPEVAAAELDAKEAVRRTGNDPVTRANHKTTRKQKRIKKP